jgi:3',5'-nucleoside bisphosphate phosphatase
MIPPEIVSASKRRMLDGIGVTDHNSTANVEAVIEAAQGEVVVFGGMELMTQEEIHLLVFFGNIEQLHLFQQFVDKHIGGLNDPDRFGEQYLVDREGYVTGTSEKLLSGALDLSIEEAVDMTHEYGGIAIAAHIDRESYSIVSQLGFIPESLALDAVEIMNSAATGYITGRHLTEIASSDAHTPEQIGSSVSAIQCEGLSFDELRKAVEGKEGRSIRPRWE